MMLHALFSSYFFRKFNAFVFLFLKIRFCARLEKLCELARFLRSYRKEKLGKTRLRSAEINVNGKKVFCTNLTSGVKLWRP